MMDVQPGTATYPRYVVAALRDANGGYVVYDRWNARVADGRYLSLNDAQWAADQRNRRRPEANERNERAH